MAKTTQNPSELPSAVEGYNRAELFSINKNKPAIAVKALTVKDCGSNPQAILASAPTDLNARHKCVRFFGEVNAVVKKTMLKDPNDANSGNREFEALSGDMRAICLDPTSAFYGQRYRSGLMYLPSGIFEMFANPIKQAKEAGEIAEIVFGIDIQTKRTSAIAGYGYEGILLGDKGEEENAKLVEFAASDLLETAPGAKLLASAENATA